ncbi:MAG: glycosyltransferase [Sphingobacteriales bacterium]|nr:glycosyltransferase [Sphingobacteriales bacterium]
MQILTYFVTYSRNKWWLPVKLLLQFPKLLSAIYREKKWLENVVDNYSFDMVISDNRLGLYHSKITSVYITHQLLIKTGNAFTEKMAQQIHGFFIKKFTLCWVPDFAGKSNLAGDLSHLKNQPATVKYAGAFSRFEKMPGLPIKYDLLVLISGPEPQRAIVENLLLLQLENYSGKVLFVRGLPGNTGVLNNNTNNRITFKSHLTAEELNIAIEQSVIVISRSGYTTIMDLIKLQKKAILIPTPGQTEQEYLAGHLMRQQFFYSIRQNKFSLEKALNDAADFPFNFPVMDMQQYKKTIADSLQLL